MLDKKRWTIPIAITLVAIVGWQIKQLTAAKLTTPISQSSPNVVNIPEVTPATTEDKNAKTVEKIADEVTVRILTDTAPGSGAIIDRTNNTYTILTCQHVLDASKKGKYRVLSPDGKIYPAKMKPAPKLKGLDLALVEFESETTYRVVKLGNSQNLAVDSVVYAAGFPNNQSINSDQIEDTTNWGRKAFRFTSGKVSWILQQSLPDGYSLGYTNDVASGMSGGPVFNDKGESIGINGRLKYPVQGIDAFIFADGTKPSVENFEKMEALSWAIPIATYQNIAKK
ncbi:serine protease [Chamaesiphon sp. VAR_48_metabat_403]|uniref:S1 family peptidase n=1 Tax=Chamaesiphon sp. VAR_48_metabat_403 TaxID=2964700 RepID=UPI00286E26C8|nr:serine protease [Chamaesiphon sp. VAR_48_metabat_403]